MYTDTVLPTTQKGVKINDINHHDTVVDPGGGPGASPSPSQTSSTDYNYYRYLIT